MSSPLPANPPAICFQQTPADGAVDGGLERVDDPGMYLTPVAGHSGAFAAALSPLPGQTKVKARCRAPHDSPPGASS